MSLLKIATLGEPVLRERARELSVDELPGERWQRFIDDLIETMRDADGAGIAANQVFTPVRAALPVQAEDPAHGAGQPHAHAARR
jgi:peptide deformylase